MPAGNHVAATQAGEHVVVAGDTLYGVAFRHGLDYRRLAAWNGIPSPYTILPGQRLRLAAPDPAVDDRVRGRRGPRSGLRRPDPDLRGDRRAGRNPGTADDRALAGT